MFQDIMLRVLPLEEFQMPPISYLYMNRKADFSNFQSTISLAKTKLVPPHKLKDSIIVQ
jgi:hypothetical protein